MQLALIAVKYKRDANVELRNHNNYFLASTIINTIFLATLLCVASVFIRRGIHARRKGLAWSRRRLVITRSATIILTLQIINLTCNLISVSLAFSGSCKWQGRRTYVLGYLQWSAWNATLLFLVIFAHNGSVWTGRTKGQRNNEKGNTNTLVLDAPWTVHLPKLLVWAPLQAAFTLMFVKYRTKGYGTECSSSETLYCGPYTTVAKIALSIFLVLFWLYFFMYLYYAWKTNAEIKSQRRTYAETRVSRMVFGVQYEQVLPVFAAFSICMTLLLTIDLSSCWTFVETWCVLN